MSVIFLPVILLFFLVVVGYMHCIFMPGRSHRGVLPPLSPEQHELATRLQRDVEQLTAFGARTLENRRAFFGAEELVSQRLRTFGLEPRRETFSGGADTVANIFAERVGRSRPEEIFVIGAHYDSVPGSPGANDNASGVAALLAIAEAFSSRSFERTVRFAAFANEEMPHFQTPLMGSFVHVAHSQERGERLVGMMSLETIGYYSTQPRSQRFPGPLVLFYPSRGDFIAFVGDSKSGPLVRAAVAAFRRHARFPSEGAALPKNLTGVMWSDHWSFRQFDIPAFMVTDTALFRYPYYHTALDTADRLDYGRMARVVDGLIDSLPDVIDSD